MTFWTRTRTVVGQVLLRDRQLVAVAQLSQNAQSVSVAVGVAAQFGVKTSKRKAELSLRAKPSVGVPVPCRATS